MGANFSFSANVAESIVKDAINVAIQYSQNCSAKLKNTQQITLTDCTITAKDININNVGVGIVKCAQDVSNVANIQQIVQQALQQSATSASQQLGILDLGRVSAQFGVNFSDVQSSLSQSIVENFTQTCTSQFANNQSFTCSGSTLYLSEGINLINYQNTITDCTFKAVSQTDAYSQLQQIVSQSAVAKEESVFSFTVVAGLVIVAVIAIIATGYARKSNTIGSTGGYTNVGGSRVSNSTAWLIVGIVAFICIIIIIYAFLANSRGWWPFLPTTSPAVGTGFQTSS